MVGPEVRQIETEIDGSIQRMPIWGVKKDVLLRRLMTNWRDGLELVQLMFAHGAMFDAEEGIQSSLATEHRMLTGVFQAIKWAMEYCKDDGLTDVSDEDLVDLVMLIGAPYQILVDALKLGAHDMADFAVDQLTKTLTIFEGGNISGHDDEIVERDHATVAFHKQNALIDDSDQLTANWTAGQYRDYWLCLRQIAESAETETILAQAGPLAPKQEIMKRPVVVELPDPPPSLAPVQKDLTLSTVKVQRSIKWKIDSWHDRPLVEIGGSIFGVSGALLTLTEFEDYMLRVALLNDPDQYQRVSGLREERMVKVCKDRFQTAGWKFVSHYLLVNPANEIDGYATRGPETMIVQLKSTLRPQSPWEVHKRNADIIDGIKHTAKMLARFSNGSIGIVITDGYEGDYATWRESLATGVAVATIDDLEWIVENPQRAFSALAERAGIGEKPTSSPVPDRSVDLCGWTLQLTDAKKP